MCIFSGVHLIHELLCHRKIPPKNIITSLTIFHADLTEDSLHIYTAYDICDIHCLWYQKLPWQFSATGAEGVNTSPGVKVRIGKKINCEFSKMFLLGLQDFPMVCSTNGVELRV